MSSIVRTILFIRHGQSFENTCGQRWHENRLGEHDYDQVCRLAQADVPLTELGERQALQLRQLSFVGDGTPATVLHSPFKRAHDTAAIAFADQPHISLVAAPTLGERGWGTLWHSMGRQHSQRHLDIVEQAYADEHFAPYGGETLASLQERISPILLGFLASCQTPVAAVVSHGDVRIAKLRALLSLSHAEYRDSRFGQPGGHLPNCGFDRFERTDDGSWVASGACLHDPNYGIEAHQVALSLPSLCAVS